MRQILITTLSLLLLTSPLFGQNSEKPCYLSVKTSGDFNPALISEISSSLVSQYIRGVKPIPSSGIRGDTKCVYDVSVTSDAGKTFVSLRGEGINSFGDSSLEGTDGFQQSLLRSIYRSQRDKRELICSDYPKILEECGGVVRKKKPEVAKLSSPKKVQLEETKREPIQVTKTKKKKDKKKPVVKTKTKKKGKWTCVVGPCDFIDEDGNLIED